MVWKDMMRRCYSKNRKDYMYYGGRGIKVCDDWHDPNVFLFDMGPRPSAAYSLERKNNNREYSPDNCRWATKKEQARNTRKNKWITIEKERKTLAEWIEMSGLSACAIQYRISKGMKTKEEILAPANTYKLGNQNNRFCKRKHNVCD